MKFKFEKLLIWQSAMRFGEDINKISENFPANEAYNLSLQIRRAADSIALNISEGAIGQSNAENRKFTGYAIRSLAETITCLYKAKARKYLPVDEFIKLYESAFNLMNMMIAYKRSLR